MASAAPSTGCGDAAVGEAAAWLRRDGQQVPIATETTFLKHEKLLTADCLPGESGGSRKWHRRRATRGRRPRQTLRAVKRTNLGRKASPAFRLPRSARLPPATATPACGTGCQRRPRYRRQLAEIGRINFVRAIGVARRAGSTINLSRRAADRRFVYRTERPRLSRLNRLRLPAANPIAACDDRRLRGRAIGAVRDARPAGRMSNVQSDRRERRFDSG